MRRRLVLTLGLLALGGVSLPAGAQASARLYVRGAGFGHGIGMSQYGAYGYAKHGWGYAAILSHYYTGTSLARLSTSREIRVLLQSGVGSASFSGASAINGIRLHPSSTYTARVSGLGTSVSGPGLKPRRVRGVARATGPGTLVLAGVAINGVASGRYRGALEFRPSLSGGLNAINALGVDDYVRGVIPGEMPAEWAMTALKVQAVAARTYGITTDAGGAGFDQYPDTRSQVYRGVAGEHPRADAAVRATAGQVVTYKGKAVATFFFSTSGGRTENIEDAFIGSPPQPWLKSVDDPYDKISPKHRWSFRFSMADAARKLGGLVRGSFRGIRVTKRGGSPRVVSALVLGSRGNTRVSGPTLRSRLGLYDTWAYFTVVSAGPGPPPLPELKHNGASPGSTGSGSAPGSSGTTQGGGLGPGGAAGTTQGGGIGPRVAQAALSVLRSSGTIVGRVDPAPRGSRILVQRRDTKRHWHNAFRVGVDRRGSYVALPGQPGTYRVVYRGFASDAIRVR